MIPIWTHNDIAAAIPKLIAAAVIWTIFQFFLNSIPRPQGGQGNYGP